jgi:hypothetical protein
LSKSMMGLNSERRFEIVVFGAKNEIRWSSTCVSLSIKLDMVTMKRKGRDRWSWDRQCLAIEDVLVRVVRATCWRETAGALTFFFEPQAGAFAFA